MKQGREIALCPYQLSLPHIPVFVSDPQCSPVIRHTLTFCMADHSKNP